MLDRFADPGVIGLLVGIVVLVGCSAFASASETALFSLSATDLATMKERAPRRGARVGRLLDDRDYTLATILIVNNVVNILVVLLSAMVIERVVRFSSPVWAFVFTSVVVTFVLLLLGEIVPKIYATYNKQAFAVRCAPVVAGLKTVLRPAAWLLVRTGAGIKGRGRENLSIEELSDALEVTEASSDEEKQILEGIVHFAGRDVGEIMHPRLDVTAIEIAERFPRVKEVIVESGFSRIPVYEENIDHIRGILYIKDVVPHIGADDGFEWQKLLRKAHFVSEHKKIDDLLEEFQTRKVHVAIVVDEYGATLGLVSLEDILEEIVGEISDESDTASELWTRTAEGDYIFDGRTRLGDFTRALSLDEGLFDDVKGEAETLAGLMIELRRGFLKKGESVESHSLRLRVMALDGRRIATIRVTPPTGKH